MNSKRHLVVSLLGLLAAARWLSVPAAAQSRASTARLLFQRAVTLEQRLHRQHPPEPTLLQYRQAASAFGRVYRVAPSSPYATTALFHAAQLYEEMGQRFQVRYFRSALDTYQLLVHEYPRSRFAPTALWRIATIEREQFDDEPTAKQFLAFLVRNYPHAVEAQQARHLLDNPASTPTRNRPAPAGESDRATARPVRVEQVVSTRAAAGLRWTIRLSGPVRFRTGRLSHPDRVYVDLWPAYLPHPFPRVIRAAGEAARTLRIAQNQPRVVRAVLDAQADEQLQVTLEEASHQVVLALAPAQGTSIETASANPETTPSAEPAAPAVSATEAASTEAAASPATDAPAAPADVPATPPPPTHSGARSLTRVLGLKVNRIVLDAGHGGSDTGTIGPHGVQEKDVCLDIALRLGKLIEQRLPAAEVIYTRTDDRFVPLQERTRLANQQQADLFISIHANSSRERSARGIETYYLNFTTSPEALEVAARENASSQQSVHELQDLLQKIARNEKIEESREFALDVQNALLRQLRRVRPLPDRGVKKAPFLVLIGAHMPSILAEVSFLSNPVDERLLAQPSYRQRIAEGLFRGISAYLASLNSITVNLHAPAERPSPR